MADAAHSDHAHTIRRANAELVEWAEDRDPHISRPAAPGASPSGNGSIRGHGGVCDGRSRSEAGDCRGALGAEILIAALAEMPVEVGFGGPADINALPGLESPNFAADRDKRVDDFKSPGHWIGGATPHPLSFPDKSAWQNAAGLDRDLDFFGL